MKHIVSINFTEDHPNFDECFSFQGHQFRLGQYCTNFNLELTKSLIDQFDGLCDVISISGLPPVYKIGKERLGHKDREFLLNRSKLTPVVDGSRLKEIFMPWLVKKTLLKNPKFISSSSVGFFSGFLQQNLVEALSEFSRQLVFADPVSLAAIPRYLKSKESLDQFVKLVAPVFKNLEMSRGSLKNPFELKFPMVAGAFQNIKSFERCGVYVATMASISLLDLSKLKGKKIILDVLNDEQEFRLKKEGVDEVLICLPQQEGIPFLNFSILEAFVQAMNPLQTLDLNDILGQVEDWNISPEIRSFKTPNYEGRQGMAVHSIISVP